MLVISLENFGVNIASLWPAWPRQNQVINTSHQTYNQDFEALLSNKPNRAIKPDVQHCLHHSKKLRTRCRIEVWIRGLKHLWGGAQEGRNAPKWYNFYHMLHGPITVAASSRSSCATSIRSIWALLMSDNCVTWAGYMQQMHTCKTTCTQTVGGQLQNRARLRD